MFFRKWIVGAILLVAVTLLGCTDATTISGTDAGLAVEDSGVFAASKNGVATANGWYEEEEIYYLALGIEEGVESQGENDIYLIGGDRVHQAQVVEFIPGEAGYSPHWNVYIVNTAPGVVVQDILNSPWASDHYMDEGVLFDDAANLVAARDAGLVTFTRPGVVVLCPIVPEKAAEAPGNNPLPEDEFDLLEPGDTF